MAKINRYDGNLKAFAADALGSERTIFGDTAQSNTLDGNITSDLFRGWGIVGVNENPTKQDFNGLGFTLGQLIAYLHQVGIPEWNTDQEFYQGSIATTLAGVYRLKSGGDGSVDPDGDNQVNWARLDEKASISGQLFTGEINYRGAGNVSTNSSYGNNALSSNTTGIENTAIGRNSLQNNTTGNANTAIGLNALSINTEGTNNTAIGLNALSINTLGNENTSIGRNSLSANTTGSNNTSVGVNSLLGNTTGSGNTGISPRNNTGSYLPVFNPTTENNRFCMGSTSVTNAYIQVAWTVVSDARDKTNFSEVPHGLTFVNELKPTSYQFRIGRDSEETNGPVRYGFKAQDVLELEGENPVIVDNEDPDKLRIIDTAMIPVLVKALQELDAKFEAYVLANP